MQKIARRIGKWPTAVKLVICAAVLAVIGLGCNPFGKDDPEPPDAAFTYDASVPMKVTFKNASTGEFTSSSWDFGDGSSSTLKSPTHTYDSPGSYSVSLRVEGPGGSDKASKTVTVKVDQKATFTSAWSRFDNSVDVVWILSNLEIHGFAGTLFTVGGYWFRKDQDGVYRYVYTDCETNVPDGYLGHQWNIRAEYDISYFNELSYSCYYDCFKEQTGTYYGSIKLYSTSSIGIDPNSTTLARTDYVSISWVTSKPAVSTEESYPVMKVLDEDESRQLESEIERLGGIREPLGL